jgi:hypothetical protein
MMNLIKTEIYIDNLKKLSKSELIEYISEYCYSSFAEDIFEDLSEIEKDNCYSVTEEQLIRNII